MDMVTDRWVRACIGVAIILISLSFVLMAAAPLVTAMRWW